MSQDSNDISKDQKRTIEQLQLDQQLLNDFFLQNPVLSFIKDENGRYVHVSQSFLNNFGVEKVNVIGKTDFQFLAAEVACHFIENDEQVRISGKAVEVIETAILPQGIVRSLVHKFPITTPSGKCFVGGIAVEIEGRLQAEELKAQLAAIVDASYDAIIGCNPAGIIATWNKSAERIFGYHTSEIIGKHLVSLWTKQNKKELTEILARLKNGDDIDQYETQHVKKDGSQIHVSVTLSPVRDASGQVTAISMVARDISKRKEMEDTLKLTTKELSLARDQALEASNLKSAFVANISHELRTPLSAILGMQQLLLDTNLTDEQREYANIVQGSAQSLLEIVKDILDLSRIEAGKFQLENIPFNVLYLIQDCARLMSESAKVKRLSFMTHIDQRIPELVLGDAERLRQMLLNLISNSIKFTETGGITVQAVVDAEDNNSVTIRFAVQDSGIGISPEEQRLLFKPFTQVDNSSTRRHGGTGLGLSICKYLAEMMGGEIGVESDKGKGSLFWFSVQFPKIGEASTSLPSQTEQTQRTVAHKSVLVVEDHPVLRTLTVRQLNNLGMIAHAVSNGHEAIAAARGFLFDIILMDCQLPDLDGFQATKAIREYEKSTGKHTPIIAIAAGAMPSDREKCLAAGMDDFLAKPISIQQLSEKISQLLSSDSACF